MSGSRTFSAETRAKSIEANKAVWADPVKRAARLAAISRGMKAHHATKRPKAERAVDPVEVPGWAQAAGLAETYATIAANRGEIAAARECRRIKAGRVNG